MSSRMIFFGSQESLVLQQGGEKTKIKACPPGEVLLPLNRLYCTTEADFKHYDHILRQQTGEQIFFSLSEAELAEQHDMPMRLGARSESWCEEQDLFRQLLALKNNRPLKLAIMGGLGAGMGDSIVGLETLRNVLTALHKKGQEKCVIDVYIRQRDYRRLRGLYSKFAFINQVKALPISMEQFKKYDAYWDVLPRINSSRFDTLTMQDFFLESLGVRPDCLEVCEKSPHGIEISQRARKAVAFRLSQLLNTSGIERPVLLFHPKSTTLLRDIPNHLIRCILDRLINETDYDVISVIDIDYQHPRFFNLSRYSQSLDDYCAFIASSNAILCVDTSIYHIAAGYQVPTLALFSSIRPELRVVYYPSVDAMLLPGAEHAPFFGQHVHDQATEVKKNQLQALDGLWQNLDWDEVIKRLKGYV